MTGNNDERLRRRGVRASRMRLNRALVESGLKSQAALADRIADLEGLDAAPKDLVNRVFRELPVDPQSLERLARALGVPAHTLYKTADELEPDHTEPGERFSASSRRTLAGLATGKRGLLVMAAVALVALAIAAVSLPQAEEWRCRVSEWAAQSEPPTDKLRIIIGRFADDRDRAGQLWLAARFSEDPVLRPDVQIVTSCRTMAVATEGDYTANRQRARSAVKEWLKARGGDVHLSGQRIGDAIRVQIVSLRGDLSPVMYVSGGRTISVDESSVEVPLALDAADESLADLKRLALETMVFGDARRAQTRDRLAKSFDTSFNWLRASIVADRNLLRTVDAQRQHPMFGMLHGELCYKERLLADLEFSVERYQRAAASCREALAVRPRDRFPEDWLTLQIQLGSAIARQQVFAKSQDDALALIDEAISVLETATSAIDGRWSMHRSGVAHINLGGIELMRALRLAGTPAGMESFERGQAALLRALEGLNPRHEPVDWALAQQNLCVLHYNRAMLVDRDKGVAEAAQGIEHCRAAASVLAAETAGPVWGMVHNNLGASLAVQAQLKNDPDSLRAAIAGFEEAKKVYTRDRLPVNWAEVEGNLGELHCNLALMTRDPALLDESDARLDAALEIATDRGIQAYVSHWEGLAKRVQTCRLTTFADCECTPSA